MFSQKCVGSLLIIFVLLTISRLYPTPYIYGVWVILAAFFVLIREEQANPNEWLLIIKNGKLIDGSNKLKKWVFRFGREVIRFPSKMEEVQFSAENITRQIQGVSIKGTAFWTVYRQNNGPFLFYKYMEGKNPNQSVRVMCESVLRNQIANSTLDSVLRNRNGLISQIKQQVKDQFMKWGVWLETIQITQVRVSSAKLFEDLQSQYRENVKLKAQQIELLNSEKIKQKQEESRIKISKLQQNISTKEQEIRNEEKIKREKVKVQFEEQKNSIEKERIEREKTFDIQEEKVNHEIEQFKINHEQVLKKSSFQFEMQRKKKFIQLEKTYDKAMLLAYQVDSLAKVLTKSNPVIQLTNFSGESQGIFPNVFCGVPQRKALQ